MLPACPITTIMISFSGSPIGGAIVEGGGAQARKYVEGLGWDMGGVAGILVWGDCIPSVSGTSDIRPPCALISSNVAPGEPSGLNAIATSNRS